MNAKEANKQLSPEKFKLKALGKGIRVERVLGNRVLVKPVIPFTDMDRVEKSGLLVVPEAVKQENTPMPTTGVVVLVGDEVKCRVCGENQYSVIHSPTSGFGDPCIFHAKLEENDMVMFSKFSGMDFLVEEEGYRIVHGDDIICTLDDTQAVVTAITEEG